MKKIILLLVAPACLFIASCGDSKTETVSIPGMMEIDLKINGNDLSVMVPDSTKGKLEMLEQSWGATEIKVGADFHISIEEGEGDVALMKSDITGNDVFKLQRYLKDESALLFWEAKNADMPDSRFHFYSVNKAGSTNYILKDVERAEPYNEKAIQEMVEAANTLKVKEAKPNS